MSIWTPVPSHPPAPPPRRLRIEIAPATLFAAVAMVGGVWVLGHLVPVLVVIAAALMLAGTLAPMVRSLEKRRVPRRVALLGMLLAVLVVAGVAGFVTLPALWKALSGFLGDFPRIREGLATTLSAHPITASLAEAVRQLRPERLLGGIELGAALSVSATMFELVGYGVTTVFLAFYLLADADRLLAALHAVVPHRFHVRLGRLLSDLETIVGGYIRGQLITSAAIAIFTFLLLTILGVHEALALAALAALTDVLPFVGGILATVPSVLVALQRGTGVGVAVLLILLAYQEFESRLLIPRIYGQTLKLPSSIVLIALLAGGKLGGIPGALFALPLAASILSGVKELGLQLPGMRRRLRPEPSADAGVEPRRPAEKSRP